MPVIFNSERNPVAAATKNVLIYLALVQGVGCTVLAVRQNPCNRDSQCQEAFGSGATCAADGYCRAAADGGSPVPQSDLADSCENSDSVPVILDPEVTATSIRVDTTDLNDRIRELDCLATDTDGNDGFFVVDMKADEKWHFYISALADNKQVDPAMYVLDSCDSQTCQSGEGIDDCGQGSHEHFSFVPQETRRYVVGVDSKEGGGSFDVLVVRPVCGNGVLEHSETCDDSNTDPGDGCDERCRVELGPERTSEAEFNDDFTGANVVRIAAEISTFTASGSLTGACDYDVYALSVPQGGFIGAALLDSDQEPCGPDTPAITMQLLDSDGVTVLGLAKPQGDNACPVLDPVAQDSDAFAEDLSEGLYFVRIGTNQGGDIPFRYQLQLERSIPIVGGP